MYWRSFLIGIHAIADDAQLDNDRVDETRIVVYAEDENGNRMHCHQGVLSILVEGDLELIGPEHIPFMGGAAAFWVKTKATGKTGEGRVQVCGQAPLRDFKESVTISLGK